MMMLLQQVARFITRPSLSSPCSSFYRRSGLREIQSGVSLKLSRRVAPMSSSTEVDQILLGKEDLFGGVFVEMTKEPLDAAVFGSSLKASLAHWRKEDKRGVWIKLPIELVNLVETAVKEGFCYHHAEPKYLMLVQWLPATKNTLPANASHRVGIGAFVLNEKNEVLVVQENSGRYKGTGVWKFPTGVVDEGEDICDAAVREVKEETGIDAKFIEILAFRQAHTSFFGKSDLSFVCMLQPLTSDIQMQEVELEAAQWMPLEEYAAQSYVQSNDLIKCVSDVCAAKVEGKYDGIRPVSAGTMFSGKGSYLYMNTTDIKSNLTTQ